MNARDELLAALTAERYDNRWWKSSTGDDAESVDTELSQARRRRLLSEDFDRLRADEREAR